MNRYLDALQPYPFEKLAALKSGVEPNTADNHISLAMGEPKHAPPNFVLEVLAAELRGISHYPLTKGMPQLREAISHWACSRFKLNALDAEHAILPVNGTREALFAFAQCVVDKQASAPTVVMPNPFYQIYEGACLLAGAQPYFVNCTEEAQFQPEFDSVPEAVWRNCQLLYICSPGNPTGAVMAMETLQHLIALADRYDFTIASDECYSELYFDEDRPPPGLLQACADMGRNDYHRCVVFHSLSKRSNLPGLRSGFVAGDAQLMRQFLRYRTYHGCAMPLPSQLASIAAWQDEQHVRANRSEYRKKFAKVLDILGEDLSLSMPDAGFYLWPKTPIDDEQFAKELYRYANVTTLPGSYLARETQTGNPGERRLRLALVAETEECAAAARRIRDFVRQL